MPAAMIERRAINERFPPSRFPGVGMIGWAVARGTGKLHERNPASTFSVLISNRVKRCPIDSSGTQRHRSDYKSSAALHGHKLLNAPAVFDLSCIHVPFGVDCNGIDPMELSGIAAVSPE